MAPAPPDLTLTPGPSLAVALLRRMLSSGVIPRDGWDALPEPEQADIASCPNLPALADLLAARRLVTPFQAGRIRAGAVNGLVLGNFRLLEKIGTGGMGIVFRAEHVKLRTPVAIKVLHVDGQKNRNMVERFFLEVRAVATLRHPNIVAAVDAGEEPLAGPDGQSAHYLVMEYVPGRNLDELVTADGRQPVARACQLAHQIADALTEAHRNGLIHRDIKPSNILVTPDGQAKLLDFGVARLPSPEDRLTQDGARLGTVGYMPPEQARNPRDVDARADVFGLAATLYFTLTGEDPFPPPGGALTAISPPRLLDHRPDAPPGLDAALGRMLALNPAQRTASAAAAMRELAPFLGWVSDGPIPAQPAKPSQTPLPPNASRRTTQSRSNRILIVDDEEPVRRICRLALQQENIPCDEVGDGVSAIERVLTQTYDLMLLDVDLPGLNGELVLRKLRQQPPSAHLKIIMFSGRTSGDDLARLLSVGADDFLTKPFSVVQLRSRVKAALRLKEAQERSDLLTKQVAASNAELERALSNRDGEAIHSRSALVLAMSKLVEQRSGEGEGHLIRLQRYCRLLADAAAATPGFSGRFDPVFVQTIEAAAPLHDLGKVSIPDVILKKTGALTQDERKLMQSHTLIGANALAEVAAKYPFATGFFHTAIEIARSHHERWDGGGYPDRIGGEAIPLAARLVTIGDVYDALRSRRAYKAAAPHTTATELMLTGSPGQFDPALLDVFRQVSALFDRIFMETTD